MTANSSNLDDLAMRDSSRNNDINTDYSEAEKEEEEEEVWSQAEVMEQCEQALKLVTESCLGHVYVSFPGKSTWEMYYVILKDAQMQFMPTIKHNTFTHSYLINRVNIRKCKKYINVPKDDNSNKSEVLKKDVLLITHDYDTHCLFMTSPIIFNTKRTYPEFKFIILETLLAKI